MIKIAVCDDDKEIRDELTAVIRDYLSKSDRAALIKDFESGDRLLKAKLSFDIIFLDIEMPQPDGIETAKMLRNWDVNSKIIYITNYSNFKSRAYKVHAFDYLDKPVTKNAIHKVLNDALRYLDNMHVAKKFAFKTEQGIVVLEMNDIYYFEYSSRKVYIVTSKGSYTSTAYSLKQIYDKMHKYNFASPHKSYIVNMLNIKQIKSFSIILDNAVNSIPLAQKRAVEFKKEYNDFLQSTFDMI